MWAKVAASQYERTCTFPSIIPDVTLSMRVPVVKAVNGICDDVPGRCAAVRSVAEGPNLDSKKGLEIEQ